MFKAVYDSPLHIPISAWIGCAIAIGIALSRRKLAGFTALFAIVCALDAWLTGPWTPLKDGSTAATAAGVTFVIAGDLRFFALALRSTDHFRAREIALAVALSFVVPVLSQIARALGLVKDGRELFLIYELLFFLLTLALHVLLARPHAKRLARFVIAQYALWALADVVILGTGADVGHLARVVPNLMYYAIFLPWAVAVERPSA